MHDSLYRLVHGVRKIAAGLRPFSESVWPGARTDLFVAHESVYAFAARSVRGCDVLDAGCGSGYGSDLLARAGARSVMGVDLDRRNIAYAVRHYGRSGVAFCVADLEEFALPAGSFDFTIASNSLEHLHEPKRFLDRLRLLLRPGGRALISVPPIYSEADLEVHRGIHYHRSNLPVQGWTDLMQGTGFRVSAVLHKSDRQPDFRSHRPSALTVDDFTFIPAPVERLLEEPSIGAIYDLRV